MKSLPAGLLILALFTMSFSACKKVEPIIPAKKEMLTHNITVENIVGQGGVLSQTNKSYINLYDGLVYTHAEAELVSSKVDFAYNYKGAGCNTCRYFENILSISTRTTYVTAFSTITQSEIANAELLFDVSPIMFENIKTGNDIENRFETHVDATQLNGHGDINDRVTDVAAGRVFAFIDKVGRKGFFLVSDYLANVPSGDKATLQLEVKILKD
jgi:hypothetical protein